MKYLSLQTLLPVSITHVNEGKLYAVSATSPLRSALCGPTRDHADQDGVRTKR